MICPNCHSEDFAGFGNRPWSKGEGLKCMICGWKIDEYVPNPDKKIWHPKDIEYFKEFSAPIAENNHRLHFTLVNSTIPFFSPMLYYFVRQIGAEQILEIGTAEGHSSFYLAHGVKDNATRFNMQGNHYYGIDIVQTESTRERLEKEGLPVTILNKDSMTLDSNTFPNIVFDMIFQDGCHDEEHVLYEFNAMWGQLKGKGDGYWIAHDCYGPAEEGCRKLIQKIKDEKIDAEFIRLTGMYGLLIIRKLEGLDPEKRFWTDG
jgi:hypothetical protein